MKNFTSSEKLYFKTFEEYCSSVEINQCSHCLEVNYLLQKYGFFECLQPKHIKVLLNNYNSYIQHNNNFQGTPWNEKLERLNPNHNDKINLFKGFVLLEQFKDYYQEPHLHKYLNLKIGSSLTQSIFIFRELQRLGLASNELKNWTSKNRTNDYIPYGNSRNSFEIDNFSEFTLNFRYEEIIEAKHLLY